MAASVKLALGMLITVPTLGVIGVTGVVRVNHTSRKGATFPHVGRAGRYVGPVDGVAFCVVELIVVQAASTVMVVALHGSSFTGKTGLYAQISKEPPFKILLSGQTRI